MKFKNIYIYILQNNTKRYCLLGEEPKLWGLGRGPICCNIHVRAALFNDTDRALWQLLGAPSLSAWQLPHLKINEICKSASETCIWPKFDDCARKYSGQEATSENLLRKESQALDAIRPASKSPRPTDIQSSQERLSLFSQDSADRLRPVGARSKMCYITQKTFTSISFIFN